jgi:Ser/Thr protein kinase RdoA (MazF antagonist)
LELTWLAAMRQDADLPVPEPIPCLDGSLLTQVSIPGTNDTRYCSLLCWVKGRYILNQTRAHHYRAQGRLMARMHNFASQWKIPLGLFKRAYDRDGLFMNDAEIGLPTGESWKLLPQDWVKPFGIVASQFRQLTDVCGKGPDTYGLIHADMGVDSNVLFWRGEPRLIDFDSSGFGYWIYDLAVAIEHCRDSPVSPGAAAHRTGKRRPGGDPIPRVVPAEVGTLLRQNPVELPGGTGLYCNA